MKVATGAMPATGIQPRPKSGATLEEDQKVEMIRKGDIKPEELSLREREQYADLIDPLKRAGISRP